MLDGDLLLLVFRDTIIEDCVPDSGSGTIELDVALKSVHLQSQSSEAP